MEPGRLARALFSTECTRQASVRTHGGLAQSEISVGEGARATLRAFSPLL
jgi:hypothetical protein